MPQSYIEYNSGLTGTTFSVPFKYISVDDVHALGYDGTYYSSLAVASRDASAKTITLAAAPSAYTKVRVYRSTATEQLVDFQNGSRLSEADLDTAYQQGLFVAQEVSEDANTNQYTDLTDQALLAANTSLSEFSSSAHTGDGTATTFDLSFVPKTETPQAFLVIVDGILQSPVDAYTMSINPAQITFASVPPASSKIVVTTTAAATGTLVEDTDLEAGVRISIDPPADPKVGELWFDSKIMTMFAYYDDGQGNPQWVSISSSVASPEGGPVNVKDFGAKGDGVTDDTVAIQAALDEAQTSKSSIVFPAGIYSVSGLSVSNTIHIEGYGATLKAVNGANGAPIIMEFDNVNTGSIHGLTFDGNTANVTSFDTVLKLDNCSDIAIVDTIHQNSRGKSLVGVSCSRTKIFGCSFKDCGIYNRTSLDNADRRQAIAFTGAGSDNSVDNCTFENVGLDCVSMASGEVNPKCTNNVFKSNDAGTIYFSNCSNFLISGNIVNNIAGGNGIDVPNSVKGIISGNICKNNGAAGILVAGSSSNITIANNICYNNYSVGSGPHKGGITLYITGTDSMNSISIRGNRCFDDNGVGLVTQRYALDINDNGSSGDFSKLHVSSDNNLLGYDSGGNESKTDVVRQGVSDIEFYPFEFTVTKNVNDDDSIKLSDGNKVLMLEAFVSNTNDYVKVLINNSTTKVVLDTDGILDTSDTDGKLCVYYDGFNVVLKNRLGATRAIKFSASQL